MKSTAVRLFIKPFCPWCDRAMDWLDHRGVRYETLDVIANPTAFAEMRRLSGQTLAPTLQVGDQVLADFGPDELARFWKRFEK